MSFLWDWITGVLNYLGLWKKGKTVVLTGLDNAGKTTLLHILTMDQHGTTIYPTKEELSLGGVSFTTVDLSGYWMPRGVYNNWKEQFLAADAIVFMIDATDRVRLEESKIALDILLSDEQFSTCPVLVLGNKIDKQGFIPEEDITSYFGLHQHLTGKGTISQKDLQRRPLELYMVSLLTLRRQLGYGEAFRWLAQYLQREQ